MQLLNLKLPFFSVRHSAHTENSAKIARKVATAKTEVHATPSMGRALVPMAGRVRNVKRGRAKTTLRTDLTVRSSVPA